MRNPIQPTHRYAEPPVGEACDERHRMLQQQWEPSMGLNSASRMKIVCRCGQAMYDYFTVKDENAPAMVYGAWGLLENDPGLR